MVNHRSAARRSRTVGLSALAGGVTAWALVSFLAAAMAATAAAGDKSDPCAVGNEPEFPAYDPVTHSIYVPNFGSANVSLLSGNCKPLGSVSLPPGSQPVAAAFDPNNNCVYVTDPHLSAVYVISGTVVKATIAGSDILGPTGLAFDPVVNDMVVADSSGGMVALLHNTTVVSKESVGTAPMGVAYDPAHGILLVANSGSQNVTLLGAANLAHRGSAAVGTTPESVAYDPANGLDYVTNLGSNNVTVLYGNGTHVGSIGGVSGVMEATFSQSALGVYVAVGNTGKVFVLGGSEGLTILKRYTAAVGAYGLAYDEATDSMFVIDHTNDDAYVVP